MSTTENRVTAAIDATARSLRQSLSAFWPAMGNNEMAEANIVIHLASVLKREGMYVYAEVPLVGSDSRHVDMVAFNDSMVIAAEAKRLYSSEKANEMASDYWRLLDGRFPVYDGGSRMPDQVGPIVLIVATTWSSRIHEWFVSPDRGSAPKRGPGWHELARVLEDVGPDGIGAAEVHSDPDAWGTQWLLFAWKQRADSFTPSRPVRE